MKTVEAEVKIYERKQKKKDSSGSTNEYKSFQSIINLRKDHPFVAGETVLVTAKGEYYQMIEKHEKKVEDLTQSHTQEVEGLTQSYTQEIEELQTQVNQLENDKNFLDKRLNKAYDELNEAQNEVKRLQGKGFFDYLKSALFKPKKAIEEGEK